MKDRFKEPLIQTQKSAQKSGCTNLANKQLGNIAVGPQELYANLINFLH